MIINNAGKNMESAQKATEGSKRKLATMIAFVVVALVLPALFLGYASLKTGTLFSSGNLKDAMGSDNLRETTDSNKEMNLYSGNSGDNPKQDRMLIGKGLDYSIESIGKDVANKSDEIVIDESSLSDNAIYSLPDDVEVSEFSDTDTNGSDVGTDSLGEVSVPYKSKKSVDSVIGNKKDILKNLSQVSSFTKKANQASRVDASANMAGFIYDGENADVAKVALNEKEAVSLVQ
jgi:hypothetical protein